ncbi:hypothetical protein SALBM311S_02259 [Streptomyces alboniger]
MSNLPTSRISSEKSTPSAATQTMPTNITSFWNSDRESKIRWPRPFVAAICSEATITRTATPAAIRAPTRTCGNDAGSST